MLCISMYTKVKYSVLTTYERGQHKQIKKLSLTNIGIIVYSAAMPLFVRRYDVSRARTLAEYHWVPFTFFLEGNSTATHSGFPARIFRVGDSQIHVVHVLAHYTDVRESRTSKYKIHAESIFYNHLMKCRARIQESLFALQMHNLYTRYNNKRPIMSCDYLYVSHDSRFFC